MALTHLQRAQGDSASCGTRTAIVPKYNIAPRKNRLILRERRHPSKRQTSFAAVALRTCWKVKSGGPELLSEKKPNEEKMNRNFRSISIRCATSVLPVLLTGCLLAGCSQTASPGPAQGAQAPTAPSAPPPPMASMQPSQVGAAGGQYEDPPVINATDLLPRASFRDQDFRFSRRCRLTARWANTPSSPMPAVFHDDAGTYYIESLDMLKIRLSEIPAIAAARDMSETSVFAKALASSAVRPVTARRKYGYASDGYRYRAARRSRRPVRPR